MAVLFEVMHCIYLIALVFCCIFFLSTNERQRPAVILALQ